MNRRHLFNLLVGAALAPEQLVKPVTYFLPPIGGWLKGTLLTAEDIRRAKAILARQIERYVDPPLIIDGKITSFEGWSFAPGSVHYLDPNATVQIYSDPKWSIG